MENVLLHAVTQEHVHGVWQVQNALNSNNKDNPFNQTSTFEFKDKSFTAEGHQALAGTFDMVLENEVVYNPQIKFHVNDSQIANAIITRLYYRNEGSARKATLILYFNTGLELILQKNIH